LQSAFRQLFVAFHDCRVVYGKIALFLRNKMRNAMMLQERRESESFAIPMIVKHQLA